MKNDITEKLVNFIKDVGINVHECQLDGETVIPGIRIKNGELIVDKNKLTYPGDLLHEAGHIAVKPASERPGVTDNVGNDAAEEMMSILWSYAAALHLNIDPKIVFHDGGYKGGSENLLENFKKEAYIGLPMLQWVGMTADKDIASDTGVEPFPNMIKWLRD